MLREIVEAIRSVLLIAVEHPAFPERKVIAGAIAGALTAALAYLSFDVSSPLLLAALAGIADKLVEFLVPASPHDSARQRRRRERKRSGR